MLKLDKEKWECVDNISVDSNKIDITDPCYAKDTWCRMTCPIVPGRYNCYVKYHDVTGYIQETALVRDDTPQTFYHEKREGEICVDAGLAGYFVNKPDYNRQEWITFCDFIHENGQYTQAWVNEDQDNAIKCTGFFTQSGYGDGEYNVYSLYQGQQLVGYRIKF